MFPGCGITDLNVSSNLIIILILRAPRPVRADKCLHWFREGRGRQGEREESPETDYNDGEMERVELTGNKTGAIKWGELVLL